MDINKLELVEKLKVNQNRQDEINNLLLSIPKGEPEYYEAKRLLKFLGYFLGIGSEELPTNSIVREFVGHGIGTKLHEDPQIPNYAQERRGMKLRPGMTLAIEPMINLGRADVEVLDDDWTVVAADGLPSAHYENTILITEGEPEILTILK